MFRNYITIAVRSMKKNKLFSSINIGGLSVGLAIFLFTHILANYERSYDTFFEKSDRIHIPTVLFVPGGPVNVRTAPSTPSAAAAHLREMTGIERVVRGFDRPFVAQVGDKKFYQNIRYFDDGFVDIFELDFISGDPQSALHGPTSLIISERTAEKYFGEADPMNQVITLDGKHDMHVTGVYRDLPANSHFSNSVLVQSPFEMGGSIEAFSRLTGFDPDGDWQTISMQDMTYVLLAEGVSPQSLNAQLDMLLQDHLPGDMHDLVQKIRLVHISHLNTFIEDAIGIPIYAVIQVIGVLILAVAILNYTNLAVAQGIARTREVGIRKTMGSSKTSLFGQFVVEAVAITSLASIFSVAILQMVLPALNDALNRNASFNVFTDWRTAFFLIAVVLITGLISGAYPAIALARMQVVRVLKGTMRFGKGMHRLRNFMLGLQFTFAVALTTMVLVIDAQNEKVNETAQIFDREHIVNLLQIREDMRPSYDALVHELKAIPGVGDVSGTNFVPFEGGQSLREMGVSRAPDDRTVTNLYRVDEDFMSVFGISQVAGRGLMRSRGDLIGEWEDDEEAPPTINILINELAVTEFGWNSPAEAIGGTLYNLSTEPDPSAYVVVGVVENRDLVGIFGTLKPIMFELRPGSFGKVSISVAPDDIEGTVAAIEEAWNRVYPTYPIMRNSLEDQFRNSFSLFETINKALAGLALMAVMLAGLGLFGLAAFMAEKRTKEIGLRKALGASIAAILRLLLWQFSKPVAVAIVFGTPLAVLASQQYLDFFADRVALSPIFFLVSATLVMGFAWVTVGVHAIRVARANPITALRYE